MLRIFLEPRQAFSGDTFVSLIPLDLCTFRMAPKTPRQDAPFAFRIDVSNALSVQGEWTEKLVVKPEDQVERTTIRYESGILFRYFCGCNRTQRRSWVVQDSRDSWISRLLYNRVWAAAARREYEPADALDEPEAETELEPEVDSLVRPQRHAVVFPSAKCSETSCGPCPRPNTVSLCVLFATCFAVRSLRAAAGGRPDRADRMRGVA